MHIGCSLEHLIWKAVSGVSISLNDIGYWVTALYCLPLEHCMLCASIKMSSDAAAENESRERLIIICCEVLSLVHISKPLTEETYYIG